MNASFFCCSLSLNGGNTFIQGGEYMIEALNAVAYNVAYLAESFNEKLISLDDDIHQ